MSGHSKWHNIQARKGKSDAQRGKIFTKIGREIAVIVKAGGSDPVSNPKLRDVIAKAKQNNMPNDSIERSIKKAAGDVRHAFDKFGGSLGATGCVSYLFKRKGIVEIDKQDKDVDSLMMDALELGAVDVVEYDDYCEVVTEQNEHNTIADQMKEKGYQVLNAETRLVPDSYVDLDQDKLVKFNRMIDLLEDLDDVQEVYHNVNLPDEE